MNEEKENVFRYPNDISKRRIKSDIKIILIMAGFSVFIAFFFIFSNPQSWQIANKGEMIFWVSFTIIVFSMLIGAFCYVIERVIFGSLPRTTEIIVGKDNLIRRIKYKEEIFSWETISKVKIETSIFGRRIEILNPKRKSIVIFSDIERIDELISMIKERISSTIIKEKRYSFIDYVFWILLLLIFGGLYLYTSPALKPIFHILIGVFVLFVFFRSPICSGIYGPKGKWIDWIVIIYFIYWIMSSVVELFQ